MRVTPVVLLNSFVAGHVDLMWPPSRIQNPTGVPTASIFPAHLDGAGGCSNFACLWFNQGCQPGCSKCSDKAGGPVAANFSFEDTCSEPNGTMHPTLMDKKPRTCKDGPDGHDRAWRDPRRPPGIIPFSAHAGLRALATLLAIGCLIFWVGTLGLVPSHRRLLGVVLMA